MTRSLEAFLKSKSNFPNFLNEQNRNCMTTYRADLLLFRTASFMISVRLVRRVLVLVNFPKATAGV